MKFSEHIGKGMWGFGSKLLPAIYGAVTVVVYRELAKDEIAALGLFQTIFAMLFTFSDNFALQAIVKFGVEPDTDLAELLTASSLLFFGFLSIALCVLVLFPTTIGSLLNNTHLPALIPYLLILVIVTIPRVVASKVFQMNFHAKEQFIIDLLNFGGASAGVLVLAFNGSLHSAQQVVDITIVCAVVSSAAGIWLARNNMSWRPKYSKAMVKKILQFTRYQSATGTVHVFQQYLDAFLVSGFLGDTAFANYSAAKTFYRGYDVLRDTQGMFVFPASSKYYSRGELSTLQTIIEKATSFLYLAVVPIGILLVIFAPEIFHLIYGTKFDDSIPVFRILVSTGAVLPIVMVGMSSLVGIGRTKEVFRIILSSLIVNIGLAVVLIPHLGNQGAAWSFAGAMLVQAFFAYRQMRSVVPITLSALVTRGFTDAQNFVKQQKQKRS